MKEGVRQKLVIPKLIANRVKDQVDGLMKDLIPIFVDGNH
jgi:hypothetical protein